MNLNILIIDDEPQWIDFTKKADMFNIKAVPDVEKALQELANRKIDLLIASAWQLDRLKRIQEKYSDKPMMITTVEPNSQEARKAYRLGAKRYFTKSFNYEDLLQQILKVMPAQI